MEQIWPLDDRKTPNIEGPGVVSIETDPYAKRSLSKVFLRKRQKDYGKKGSQTTTTTIKGVLLPVFSLYKSPSKNILTMIIMLDLYSTIM